MLSMSTAIIAIMNIIFVGLLPRIFFRRDGTFNLKWILTAAPYGLSPIFLLFNTKGIAIWEPFVFGFNSERLILESLAMPIFALSIALIAFTIGIHRVPLALWHQENDAPKNIVTHGSYAWVRHPFYTFLPNRSLSFQKPSSIFVGDETTVPLTKYRVYNCMLICCIVPGSKNTEELVGLFRVRSSNPTLISSRTMTLSVTDSGVLSSVVSNRL